MFLLTLMFYLQQKERTRGRNRFCPEAGCGRGGGGSNNAYTSVNVKTIK
jgi:hypothetical protein